MRKAINVGVLAMIALVAVSLLVVGITKARQANARFECQMNLRQIGLALLNYHDSSNQFPPATLLQETLPPEKRLSWLVACQPYTEALFVVIDREKSWDSDENREPRWREKLSHAEHVLGQMPLFQCPSNPNRAQPGWPGLTHYVGIAGLGDDAVSLPLRNPDGETIDPRVGFFGYDRVIRLQDIKKSRDNTTIVAETKLNNGAWTAGGPPTTRGLESGRPYLGPDGHFGGTHPGGANVLFLDGSARSIDDGISPRVFEQMASLVNDP